MSREMLYRESVVHRSDGLPLKIYDSSHVKYHWHDEYEFLLAEHNGTVCSVGGRQITLNVGDSMMIKGGELHSLSLEAGKSVTAVVVHPAFWAGDDVSFLERMSFTALFRGESEIGSRITLLLRRIKECYLEKNLGYEFLLKTYFCNIFAILIENGEYEEYVKPPEAQSSPEAALFEYVHNNICNDISLDMLCKATHFSKSYVVRLFKKHTGQTPTEYINRCRTELAKELLSAKSVTDTALDCGFNNVSYFIRVFKRYTGSRPGEWKSKQ